MFWEPVEHWRFFARHAKRVLEMAAATYNGQVMESGITEQLFPVPPSVEGAGVARPSVQRRRDKGVRPDRPLFLLQARKNIFEHGFGHIMQAGSSDMGHPPGKAEMLTRQACSLRAAWRTSKPVTRGRFRQQQAASPNQREQTSKRTRGPLSFALLS